MAQAVKSVINAEMSYNKAAEVYGVPQTTLERRVIIYRQNPDLELATMKGKLDQN